ncbi:STAS domain-containing protein [Nocardioides panacis]|uniref:STAS domain-containing protein n=1 Tax=Nocardioides panacis TaxID=2849501 RepID=A0A975T1Q2_9ACTN|nr:STAS domain-containing protein [Nocardioides panacis]QWZ09926.1 STAS domain-containing protein [Nocardioides panacis]
MRDRRLTLPLQRTPARDGEAAQAPTCVRLHPGTGPAVVALVGELDLDTAPQLSPVIRRLLAQGRSRITINLDEVTFMDGFTLGLLIRAHHDVARAGGFLDLTHNRLCARLMVVTGTTTFLHP